MAEEMRVYVHPELKGQVEEIAKLMNLSPTKVGQIALSLGLRKLFSLYHPVREREDSSIEIELGGRESFGSNGKEGERDMYVLILRGMMEGKPAREIMRDLRENGYRINRNRLYQMIGGIRRCYRAFRSLGLVCSSPEAENRS